MKLALQKGVNNCLILSSSKNKSVFYCYHSYERLWRHFTLVVFLRISRFLVNNRLEKCVREKRNLVFQLIWKICG